MATKIDPSTPLGLVRERGRQTRLSTTHQFKKRNIDRTDEHGKKIVRRKHSHGLTANLQDKRLDHQTGMLASRHGNTLATIQRREESQRNLLDARAGERQFRLAQSRQYGAQQNRNAAVGNAIGGADLPEGFSTPSAPSGNVTGGIFRLVGMGMAIIILYIFLTHSQGTTLINKVGAGLITLTSGKAIFKDKSA